MTLTAHLPLTYLGRSQSWVEAPLPPHSYPTRVNGPTKETEEALLFINARLEMQGLGEKEERGTIPQSHSNMDKTQIIIPLFHWDSLNP